MVAVLVGQAPVFSLQELAGKSFQSISFPRLDSTTRKAFFATCKVPSSLGQHGHSLGVKAQD